MRFIAAILLFAIVTPAIAQQQTDSAHAIALQIGQLAIANAQLIERNAQLQSRVDDLEKKLANAVNPASKDQGTGSPKQ